jgi:hypothetical protein
MVVQKINQHELKLNEINGIIREKENSSSKHMKSQKDLETSLNNQKSILEERETKRNNLIETVENLEHESKKKEKMLIINQRKEKESIAIKAENEAIKEKIKLDLQLMTRDFEAKKKIVDEDKKEIDQNMRQRDLLGKDVACAEEDERRKQGIISTLENELKKLQNKI